MDKKRAIEQPSKQAVRDWQRSRLNSKTFPTMEEVRRKLGWYLKNGGSL
jgi:hypothetical protein